MYYLIQGTLMSLPHMIIIQMREAPERVKACLSYGMVFILIFTKFGVNLDEEDTKRLMHTEYYNKWSIHRMGYHKVDDRRMKQSLDQEPVGDEDKENDEIAVPFSPPLAAPSGSVAPLAASPSA